MHFTEADNMSAKSWYNKRYTPEQIKEIQRTLGVEEDGLIGPDTINAIKEYQEAAGLKADGLWGKSTQAKADEWNAQYDSIQPTFGKGKDTDVLKEAAYKQYSDNLENRYFLDEQNKYESNFKPNYEITNVELAQLNAEIEKVRMMIAERKAKYEGVPQPKTQVGWSSYIVNNDRGMLDKYQDAERNWYTLKEQERHAKELADAQRQEQRAINLNDARDTLAKLQIMKDTAVQQGHDTRDIDVQINSVYRDYPELKNNTAVSEPYDPRKSVEYVLADIEDIDDNNTQEEIKEAIERVSKYNTPNSIKTLNRLDKTLTRRIKKEESKEKYDSEVNNWINGGATSNYLYNLGLETQFAGDKERLVNKKTGKVVAERSRNKKSAAPTEPAPTNNNSWEI